MLPGFWKFYEKKTGKTGYLTVIWAIIYTNSSSANRSSKITNFPAVLYQIDRKVQKLAFKFVGLILLSGCKWQLDAPKLNAAVRPCFTSHVSRHRCHARYPCQPLLPPLWNYEIVNHLKRDTFQLTGKVPIHDFIPNHENDSISRLFPSTIFPSNP